MGLLHERAHFLHILPVLLHRVGAHRHPSTLIRLACFGRSRPVLVLRLLRQSG
jgi:hypothetical protein